MGAAQAWESEADLFRLRAPAGEGARYQRTGSAGPSLYGVQHHGNRRDLSGVLPRLRREDRKSPAVAEQSTIQQTL